MKLQDIAILNKKQVANLRKNGIEQITKGKVLDSFIRLIQVGRVCTGSSGYSKGWSQKSIWTNDIAILCRKAGIEFTTGNDAPKGGASGEYVEATNKRQLAKQQSDFKKAQAKEKADYLTKCELDAIEKKKRYEDTEKAFTPEIADKFRQKWASLGKNPKYISHKEANQFAWKKQNYLNIPKVDIVTLRSLVKDAINGA